MWWRGMGVMMRDGVWDVGGLKRGGVWREEVSLWVVDGGGCMGVLVGEWVGKWVGERVGGWANEWVDEHTHHHPPTHSPHLITLILTDFMI